MSICVKFYILSLENLLREPIGTTTLPLQLSWIQYDLVVEGRRQSTTPTEGASWHSWNPHLESIPKEIELDLSQEIAFKYAICTTWSKKRYAKNARKYAISQCHLGCKFAVWRKSHASPPGCNTVFFRPNPQSRPIFQMVSQKGRPGKWISPRKIPAKGSSASSAKVWAATGETRTKLPLFCPGARTYGMDLEMVQKHYTKLRSRTWLNAKLCQPLRAHVALQLTDVM